MTIILENTRIEDYIFNVTLGQPEDSPQLETASQPTYNPMEEETVNYTCSSNTYNCSDFQTQAQAQAMFIACGGLNNDVHYLDGDNDGIACETLP